MKVVSGIVSSCPRAPRLGVLWGGAAILIGTAFSGCGELVVDDRNRRVIATGAVEGSVYLDMDGSGTQNEADLPFAGLRLQLVAAGGGGVIRTVMTDTLGSFRFDTVPVGAFQVIVDPVVAPDSVDFIGLPTNPFTIGVDATHDATARAVFPFHTLAEARNLPPGIRILTRGIVLNSRAPFGDGVVHFKEGSVHLRAMDVERTGIGPGDSVHIVGRTASSVGRPILNDVRVFTLIDQAQLVVPIEVTSASAATASNQTLDAALVRIRNAVIRDTTRVGGQLIVRADDGSGPIDLVLRDFIDFGFSDLRPDSAVFREATGLLVPVQVAPGEVRWRITPRESGDLTVDPIIFPAPEEPPEDP